ncbi:MAG: 1,4-alpha-glucan branching protein GlgB, partial [Anaerolinea sp.]|nr:1,4-alpha-glucan branching protein GlgB [Anaerolinea sp.]
MAVETQVHPDAIRDLLNATHGDPFAVLGAHVVGDNQLAIRAVRPSAKTLAVVIDATNERFEMTKLRPEGFFEVTIPGEQTLYHFEEQTWDEETRTFYDPYAFSSLLTEYDLYLLGEGKHLYSYEKLGAHVVNIDGITGVNFVVWAPSAQRVSVIGDFNGWDARLHPMRLHPGNGIWELFIPGIGEGSIYRFNIHSRYNSYRADKSDPYAFFVEKRPKNASVVYTVEGYEWNDAAWMEARKQSDPLTQAWAIYEVHAGSWKRKENNEWLTYRELADELVPYLMEMGYTHIELMPIAEHPLDESWGYQVTGYYAVTSRYGTPKDFMYFVDQCHQNGIGVILDWVPAHFPKDGYALSFFDGTHLYSHADARRGEHPDWGTYIFNYGRNEVRNFLISNALFWLREYHIDGLRVDAVSSMLYLDFSRKAGEWLPNQHGGRENLEAISFLQEFNTIVHNESPGAVTIAEESTSWPMVSRPTYLGGLGFTFKWNMGWMHDTLDYMKLDPIFRRYGHNHITFSLFYAFSENFVLSLSHDEVVHLKGSLIQKMSGDWWQKFASLRLLFAYQYTHPGKKLNFMGQEIAQWREWSELRQLDWNLLVYPTHTGMQRWVRDLNHLLRDQPALQQHDFDLAGFQWIEVNDVEQSAFAYVRFADDPADFLVVALNFTPVVRKAYRIGVPEAGFYKEILNSDSTYYGGSDVGNDGGVQTDDIPYHIYQQSLNLTLPPLGAVVL